MTPKRWMSLLALTALLALPAVAYDDEEYEPPEDRDEVEFVTGYQGSTTDRERFKVAEYDVVEPRGIGGLGFRTSPYEDRLFEFRLLRTSSRQFEGAARLDLDRVVRIDAEVDGLLHRLDHDPLTNLQAVSEIKVVRSTDLEPGRDYQIRYRLYDVLAEFQHPDLGWLTFRGGVREQQRDGIRQVLTTSHCTSCHTVGQGRTVDRSTSEATFGAHVRRGRVDFDYQVTTRTFTEDGLAPTTFFERAYRPAGKGPPPITENTLVLPFNDRLWFQDTDVVSNRIPEIKRTSHRFQARADYEDAGALTLTVVRSGTENQDTGNDYEFGGYRARYTWRPRDRVRLSFYAERDDIDNDTVRVNLAALSGLPGAPISDSGPGYVGITYADFVNDTIAGSRPVVGGTPVDFTTFLRRSSLDRTDDRLGVDGWWRPGRKSSYRLGYRYRRVDRDNVILADNTGETTSHTLKASWNHRATKKLRWNNNVTYTATDNPYVAVDGGLRAFDPARPGVSGSPKLPPSLQYFELHELRVANLSNVPTDQLRFRSQVTWAPSVRWAVSANTRYRDAENDELNFTEWQQETGGVGFSVWAAASPRFHFTLALDTYRQETDTAFIVPVMDG